VKKKLIRYWLPVIVWAIVIFAFSSFPTGQASGIDWQDFIVKKTAHIVEYGILTLLLYRALKQSGIEKKDAALYSLTLAVFYAVTDEFHQSFTPGREPTLRDVIFDTIGGILAIYSLWKLLPKAPRPLTNWAKKLELL